MAEGDNDCLAAGRCGNSGAAGGLRGCGRNGEDHTTDPRPVAGTTTSLVRHRCTASGLISNRMDLIGGLRQRRADRPQMAWFWGDHRHPDDRSRVSRDLHVLRRTRPKSCICIAAGRCPGGCLWWDCQRLCPRRCQAAADGQSDHCVRSRCCAALLCNAWVATPSTIYWKTFGTALICLSAALIASLPSALAWNRHR